MVAVAYALFNGFQMFDDTVDISVRLGQQACQTKIVSPGVNPA